MTLRIAIVDDEPLVRQGIAALLGRQPDLEIVACCGDGLAAIAAIEAERPDLLFLDVLMPALDGFEVLEALDLAHLPGVVFVTAHDDYALQAFGVHAVDYVLKPFDDERLLTALDRARKRLFEADRVEEALRALLREREAAERRLRQFVVRRPGAYYFVPTHRVEQIRACDNYVVLHDDGGRTHMVRGTIKALEARLDPTEFCRVHRSTIVRVEAVRAIRPRPSGDADIELASGARVRLSRRRKREVLARVACSSPTGDSSA